ncbi:hypothetical protein MD484_g5315, partial [Candolleomyces efflorescens]
MTPLVEGQPFYEEVKEYKDHFLPAINAEQLEDEAVLQERLANWDLEKLQEEGYCLTDMLAFWMQKQMFGMPTATFQLGPGITLPEHRFEKGTQVLLSRTNPLKEPPIRGSVVSTTPSQLRISFQERIPGLDSEAWRLDVGRPNLVFERMRAAVLNLGVCPDEVVQKENEDCRTSTAVGAGGGEPAKSMWEWKEYVLQGTALRDVLLRGFRPEVRRKVESAKAKAGVELLEEEEGGKVVLEYEDKVDAEVTASGSEGPDASEKKLGVFAEDQRIQSWARRYSLPVPLVMDGDMALKGMNPSQIRAMALMVGNRVSLVQGPPGTGKTKTIIQTLKLLKSHFSVPHPILVCTYTNAAVDNLVEGMAAAGLKPLRVGYGPSIRPDLIPYSLHHKLEVHPRAEELKKLDEDEVRFQEKIEELHEKMHALVEKMGLSFRDANTMLSAPGSGSGKGRWEGRYRNMKASLDGLSRQVGITRAKSYALQQEMLREVVEEADVICTTCITAATSSLNIIDFPIVFLDEASMSTEPATLIPLMKGCRHLALIGDHKQLPPVILSQEAKDIGLGVSLFERLTQEGHTPSIMLDTQYRMHPNISSFPSNEFYLGGVRDGTIDAEGNVIPGLMPPKSVYLEAIEAPESDAEEAGGLFTPSSVVASGADTAETRRVSAAPSKGRKRANEREELCHFGQPSVIFLDHDGAETTKDRSRVNHAEAHIVASVVVDLLLNNPELRGSDIGIIAPYVAQISQLTRIFNNADSGYQTLLKERLGDHRYMQLGQIEIKTVDGFEGREKEVIVFSTDAAPCLPISPPTPPIPGPSSDTATGYVPDNPALRTISGCGCPRSSLSSTTTTVAASPRMASHVFYSSAQPHQAQWHQPPIDLAHLNTQLAGLSLQQQHQPPKHQQQHQPVAQHAPSLPPPKFTPPLLTPSGRAFAVGGRVQNVSSDPLSPCIMWWPDNEPFPEQGQIRPNNVVGVAQPPILNTGNRGPISHQPGDWICQKCNYLNWRRRKVCQTCLPYAEGNGDSISAAVQAERIALLTQTQAPRTHAMTPPQVRTRVSVPGDTGPGLRAHAHPQGSAVLGTSNMSGLYAGKSVQRSRSHLTLGAAAGFGDSMGSPIYETGGPATRATIPAQYHQPQQQRVQQERFLQPPPQRQQHFQQQRIPSPLYATGPLPGSLVSAAGGLKPPVSAHSRSIYSTSSPSHSPSPEASGGVTPMSLGGLQNAASASLHAPAPLLPSFLQDMVQTPPSLSPASNASGSSTSSVSLPSVDDHELDAQYPSAYRRVRVGSESASESGRSSNGGEKGLSASIWSMDREEERRSPYGVGVIGMGRVR